MKSKHVYLLIIIRSCKGTIHQNEEKFDLLKLVTRIKKHIGKNFLILKMIQTKKKKKKN